jgi:aryl-alcohol dehydrogenase-like predicted oxidoreductase
MPRFQDGNVESNLQLVQTLHEIADARGATAAQLAIAWVLAQRREPGDIVAVVASRTRRQLAEALPAAGLVLTDEELAAIEEAVPISAVAGDVGMPGIRDGER